MDKESGIDLNTCLILNFLRGDPLLLREKTQRSKDQNQSQSFFLRSSSFSPKAGERLGWLMKSPENLGTLCGEGLFSLLIDAAE